MTAKRRITAVVLLLFVVHGCTLLQSVIPPKPETVGQALALVSTAVRVAAESVATLHSNGILSTPEAVAAYRIIEKAATAVNAGWKLWADGKLPEAQAQAEAANRLILTAREIINLGEARKSVVVQ